MIWVPSGVKKKSNKMGPGYVCVQPACGEGEGRELVFKPGPTHFAALLFVSSCLRCRQAAPSLPPAPSLAGHRCPLCAESVQRHRSTAAPRSTSGCCLWTMAEWCLRGPLSGVQSVVHSNTAPSSQVPYPGSSCPPSG